MEDEQERKMNVAIIIAGGSGRRMGMDIPKQFVHVYEKPVLLYTLEGFQAHPMIDAIEVVCIEGWHDVVWAYAKQCMITKLKWVVPGGSTGQESIRNGVYALEGICSEGDTVIIHDGIRPLVDQTVLTDVLRKCDQYGNGVTSIGYEAFESCDALTSVSYAGTSDPGASYNNVFTNTQVTSVNVPWNYESSTFCGVNVSRMHAPLTATFIALLDYFQQKVKTTTIAVGQMLYHTFVLE